MQPTSIKTQVLSDEVAAKSPLRDAWLMLISRSVLFLLFQLLVLLFHSFLELILAGMGLNLSSFSGSGEEKPTEAQARFASALQRLPEGEDLLPDQPREQYPETLAP